MTMRLLKTILPSRMTEQGVMSKVYRDTDWGEYRVKFYCKGAHQAEGDYHCDTLVDAIETARRTVEMLNNPAKEN